jgi:hypothetical protein
MHIDPCKEAYEQYMAAAQELAAATKAARSLGLKMPFTNVTNDEQKEAYERLLKADHVYAEKYSIWTKCLAKHPT